MSKVIKVKVTTFEEILGTASANPEIHELRNGRGVDGSEENRNGPVLNCFVKQRTGIALV